MGSAYGLWRVQFHPSHSSIRNNGSRKSRKCRKNHLFEKSLRETEKIVAKRTAGCFL